MTGEDLRGEVGDVGGSLRGMEEPGEDGEWHNTIYRLFYEIHRSVSSTTCQKPNSNLSLIFDPLALRLASVHDHETNTSSDPSQQIESILYTQTIC